MRDLVIKRPISLMQRCSKWVLSQSQLLDNEFFVLATRYHGSSVSYFIARATAVPPEQNTNKQPKDLLWTYKAEQYLDRLNLERIFLYSGAYAKPLPKNSKADVQWCRLIENPMNGVYIDSKDLCIYINSIAELWVA